MIVSVELKNALEMLADTNILNTNRVISDFLRASALEDDVCSYIEQNAKHVSFEDELHAYFTRKKFPAEPKICIPFVYTLLYVFDTEKITTDDFVSSVYPQKDLDEAIEIFFKDLTFSLTAALCQADLNPSDSDAKTNVTDSENGNFVMDLFTKSLSDIIKENADEIREKIDALQNAIQSNDPVSMYSAYSDLCQTANVIGNFDEPLRRTKDLLAGLGVSF